MKALLQLRGRIVLRNFVITLCLCVYERVMDGYPKTLVWRTEDIWKPLEWILNKLSGADKGEISRGD